MKLRHFLYLLPILLSSSLLPAQNIRIAVVDMNAAMQTYYKKDIEIKAINSLGEEKIRNIDERKAAYAKMTSEMVDLDKKVRAVELSEESRRQAGIQLRELAQTRAAKAAEINDAERKAQQELMEARTEMEQRLLGEIRKAATDVVKGRGFDLVFDKSLFPKTSKAILFTSPNVPDLTQEVIDRLNAAAPPSN